MKKYAIIVAGGQGLRMGEGIPKQFLILKGKPVLFHTLEKFRNLVDQLILVLPESHLEYWKNLSHRHDDFARIKLVTGGETRTASVLNGLNAIDAPGMVAIHDAVRPFISRTLIETLFQETAIHGNAVPVIPIRESMRKRDAQQNHAVNREAYVAVQTPQCFNYETIKEAYQRISGPFFTDDASVFEFAGGKVNLVAGETTNIKITYREDILLAEAMLDATTL